MYPYFHTLYDFAAKVRQSGETCVPPMQIFVSILQNLLFAT